MTHDAIRGAKFWTDLNRIEEGPKFSQKPLAHVVATASVGQDQDRRPAAAAGRRQLHKHTDAALKGGAQPGGPAPERTLAYSSACLRRSLFTRWR